MTLRSARTRNQNYSNLFCTQRGNLNVRGIATAAVAELLNSQVGLLQLVSFLTGAGNPINVNCLNIELTKNVG